MRPEGREGGSQAGIRGGEGGVEVGNSRGRGPEVGVHFTCPRSRKWMVGSGRDVLGREVREAVGLVGFREDFDAEGSGEGSERWSQRICLMTEDASGC